MVHAGALESERHAKIRFFSHPSFDLLMKVQRTGHMAKHCKGQMARSMWFTVLDFMEDKQKH